MTSGAQPEVDSLQRYDGSMAKTKARNIEISTDTLTAVEAINGGVHGNLTEHKGPSINIKIIEENDIETPPDGGWGWFIVLGSAIAHFVIGGLERSGGVIYLELLEKFEDSASATSWVASLNSGLRLVLGPVASALSNRFSTRAVVFAGSLILTAGCILSAFSPALYFVHLSYGVIGGIGLALCYTPCVVIVGMYFDKRRGLAVGLATAGAGLGTFCIPPLTEYLFNQYGFTGAFILLGGYLFNMLICAMLFRPLDRHWTITRRITYENNGNHENQRNHDEYAEHGALLERTESYLEKEIENEVQISNFKAEQNTVTHRVSTDNNSVIEGKEVTKSTETENAEDNGLIETKLSSEKKTILEIRLLKDPMFLSFCISLGLFTAAYIISVVFLPALAESKGLSKMEAAFLVSVTGITDTIGRFTSGIFFDRKSIRPYRRYLYNACLPLVAVNTFLCPSMNSFVGFICVSLIFGLLTGTYKAQISVIVVDLLGKEKLGSSFGIAAVWFQGIGALIGPPIAGKLRDSFGNYDVAFYFGGLMTVIAGATLMFSNIYFFCKKENSIQSNHAP